MTQREEDDNNAINDLISSASVFGAGGARGIGFRIDDDPIEIKKNGVFGGNTTGYVTSFRITPNGDFLIGKVDGSGGNAKVVSNLPKKSGETDAQYKARTEGYNDALVALNKRFPRQILPTLKARSKQLLESTGNSGRTY